MGQHLGSGSKIPYIWILNTHRLRLTSSSLIICRLDERLVPDVWRPAPAASLHLCQAGAHEGGHSGAGAIPRPSCPSGIGTFSVPSTVPNRLVIKGATSSKSLGTRPSLMVLSLQFIFFLPSTWSSAPCQRRFARSCSTAGSTSSLSTRWPRGKKLLYSPKYIFTIHEVTTR